MFLFNVTFLFSWCKLHCEKTCYITCCQWKNTAHLPTPIKESKYSIEKSFVAPVIINRCKGWFISSLTKNFPRQIFLQCSSFGFFTWSSFHQILQHLHKRSSLLQASVTIFKGMTEKKNILKLYTKFNVKTTKQ